MIVLIAMLSIPICIWLWACYVQRKADIADTKQQIQFLKAFLETIPENDPVIDRGRLKERIANMEKEL